MAKCRFLLFIAALWMLGFQGAYAAEIQYYEAVTDLQESGSSNDIVTMTFSMPAPEKLEYPIFGEVVNFTVDADFQANCERTSISLGTMVKCDLSKMDRDHRTLTIKTITMKIANEIKPGTWLFKNDYRSSVPISALSVTVKLPEGTGLVEEAPNQTITTVLPFTPPDGEKRTDGRRVILNWHRNNVTAGSGFSVSVMYEGINKIVYAGIPAQFMVIAAVIIIVLAYFAIKKGKNILPQETLESILLVLKEDEKKVIEAIIRSNGQIIQRKIVIETGFSKAKVSRLISDLKSRGIVKVEELGRTNKIYLLKKPAKPYGTIEEQPKPAETKPADEQTTP